ncbi:hypothetical protein [Kordiimonas aestuarii]|uniref:hypothetical protein n=1 Tax=Kordiimonas aestuarii TaxID=1005925 RepID=UPI0021D3759A|nr:hypothetical protein [Kordiimonas aestuarii]
MTEQNSSTTPPKPARSHTETGVGVGVAIGVALGVAMGNVGLGICIGLAVGAGVGWTATRNARNKTSDKAPGTDNDPREG